jgi:hypothetical protein
MRLNSVIHAVGHNTCLSFNENSMCYNTHFQNVEELTLVHVYNF